MSTLDASIMNVALPSMARDFGSSVDQVAWVVLAYSLTLISLLMVFGAWIEQRGYRFAYRFGYSFFLVGSIVCACSPWLYLLVLGRVIQAVGSAMFAAIGPGMVTTIFPVEERGKWLGTMVMMVSCGFMIGPPLGGYLLAFFDWHALFIINVPIGLLGLYMIKRYFGDLGAPSGTRSVRIASAASISLGLLSAVFVLSLINEYPLSDVRMWGLGLFSLICLATFLFLESKPDHALIGLEIFKNRVFTASIGAQLMHFCALSGVLVLVPFYLEQVRSFQPRQVGLFLVIMPIFMFVLAPLSGKISDRIGFRLLTCTGMILMIGGLGLFSYLSTISGTLYIVLCLVVVSSGAGIFSTPNSSALMGSVSPDQRAAASGILATTRNIGQSVGVALAASLFAYFEQANAGLGESDLIFVASFRPVVYIGIGFSVLGLFFSLIRNNRTQVAAGTKASSTVIPVEGS